MTNTNCLEGIACPKCGNDSRMYIGVYTLAEVTDDGAETFGDMEWDSDSYAKCTHCAYDGKLKAFHVEPKEEKPTQAEKE
jgi:hypothetical protein